MAYWLWLILALFAALVSFLAKIGLSGINSNQCGWQTFFLLTMVISFFFLKEKFSKTLAWIGATEGGCCFDCRFFAKIN